MTTTTDALRAVLARLDGDLTHRDRLRLHLADTGEDDRGAWNSPLMQDALGEMDDMYAALAQAVEALDAQPPPADAALLAAANRALMERLEEAERERLDAEGCEAKLRAELDAAEREREGEWRILATYSDGEDRITGARVNFGASHDGLEMLLVPLERAEKAERLGAEHYEALVKALARAEKAERDGEIARLAARAARMETAEALDILDRRTQRDEARAEIARLRGRVKDLASFAEDRCHDADPNGRWCHCCPDSTGCPVTEDRAAHLDGEKEPR